MEQYVLKLSTDNQLLKIVLANHLYAIHPRGKPRRRRPYERLPRVTLAITLSTRIQRPSLSIQFNLRFTRKETIEKSKAERNASICKSPRFRSILGRNSIKFRRSRDRGLFKGSTIHHFYIFRPRRQIPRWRVISRTLNNRRTIYDGNDGCVKKSFT